MNEHEKNRRFCREGTKFFFALCDKKIDDLEYYTRMVSLMQRLGWDKNPNYYDYMKFLERRLGELLEAKEREDAGEEKTGDEE